MYPSLINITLLTLVQASEGLLFVIGTLTLKLLIARTRGGSLSIPAFTVFFSFDATILPSLQRKLALEKGTCSLIPSSYFLTMGCWLCAFVRAACVLFCPRIRTLFDLFVYFFCARGFVCCVLLVHVLEYCILSKTFQGRRP